MSNGSSDDNPLPGFEQGYGIPILGLLALLFALMTGVTISSLATGPFSLDYALLTVLFGAACLYSVRLRQRMIAAREPEESE